MKNDVVAVFLWALLYLAPTSMEMNMIFQWFGNGGAYWFFGEEVAKFFINI